VCVLGQRKHTPDWGVISDAKNGVAVTFTGLLFLNIGTIGIYNVVVLPSVRRNIRIYASQGGRTSGLVTTSICLSSGNVT